MKHVILHLVYLSWILYKSITFILHFEDLQVRNLLMLFFAFKAAIGNCSVDKHFLTHSQDENGFKSAV